MEIYIFLVRIYHDEEEKGQERKDLKQLNCFGDDDDGGRSGSGGGGSWSVWCFMQSLINCGLLSAFSLPPTSPTLFDQFTVMRLCEMHFLHQRQNKKLKENDAIIIII